MNEYKEMWNRSWLKSDSIWMIPLIAIYLGIGICFLCVRVIIITILACILKIMAYYQITQFTRTLLLIGTFACGWIPWTTGKENLKNNYSVAVSNHITMFDHMPIWWNIKNMAILVNQMDDQNALYKAVWPAMKPHCIVIDKSKEITQLANETNEVRIKANKKIVVFPEATIGNGKHLYGFRSFAFRFGDVLPIALKIYPAFPFINVYPFMCNQTAHVILMLAMPFVIYRVKILPVVKHLNSLPRNMAWVTQGDIAKAINGIATYVSKQNKDAMKKTVKNAALLDYLNRPESIFDVSALG